MKLIGWLLASGISTLIWWLIYLTLIGRSFWGFMGLATIGVLTVLLGLWGRTVGNRERLCEMTPSDISKSLSTAMTRSGTRSRTPVGLSGIGAASSTTS